MAYQAEYARLLGQHKQLAAYLDDQAVTLEIRRGRLGEFSILTKRLNCLIEDIGRMGHAMNRQEVLEGFGQGA